MNEIRIKNKIFTIRGKQVIIDKDLAELYEVPTKRLNEQVKRNIERFPEHFMFKLTEAEKNELVANCDRLKPLKHSSNLPKAFTEQGVSMLSAVLKSQKAIEISIQIIDAFVAMRRFLSENAQVFQRMNLTEMKLIEHDNKINELFNKFETETPKQGIFYEGQIFDAYKFVSDLIKKAKKRIILIDNYIDESVLILFSKRKKDVKILIYTKKISKQLQLDIKKFNEQYEYIEVKEFNKAHDRFLIIDEENIYHFGASLKDLGKKMFAFSRFNEENINLLKKVKEPKKQNNFYFII